MLADAIEKELASLSKLQYWDEHNLGNLRRFMCGDYQPDTHDEQTIFDHIVDGIHARYYARCEVVSLEAYREKRKTPTGGPRLHSSQE